MGLAHVDGIEIGKLRDARAHARLLPPAARRLRRDDRRAAGDGRRHRRYGGTADRHRLCQRLFGRQAGARRRAGAGLRLPAHHAVQKRISGRDDIPYYGWHYPPVFLLVAAALAALPYLGALFVYQAATLVAYLAVVRRIAGGPRPGCWRSPSRPYSSTSRTATTASSPRRCWAARSCCSTAGRCLRERCWVASPTSRSSGCWCRWCWLQRGAGA